MKKIISVLLSILMLLMLSSCAWDTAVPFRENVVLDESETYAITSDIHSLQIEIKVADFKITEADSFSVESNLKYLSVSEKNGVLTIVDQSKDNSDYEGALLTLRMPSGTVLNDADIITGVGKLTVDRFSVAALKLELGVGDVLFSDLTVSSEAEIEGGTGEITVENGTLNNLSLEMGVGELNLKATLYGVCDLEFGVGASNINLVGSREDYKIDIEKGLGSITVDGKPVIDIASIGNGCNHINIDGGIGAVNLTFEE